jgi:hypothetical protein
MPRDLTAEIAEVMIRLITQATAPIKSDLTTAITRIAEIEARALVTDRESGTARERLASLEARAPIPGPPGADGAPGRDGVDGFACDELTATVDDDRVVTLGYRRGEVTKAIATLRLPIPAYRGVFESGRPYEKGDLVTWGGCVWHCNGATTTRPGTGAPEWTLAVKAGRDGRDLRAEGPR